MPTSMSVPSVDLRSLLAACGDDPLRLTAYITEQASMWLTTIHLIGQAVERGELPGLPGVLDHDYADFLIELAQRKTENTIEAFNG